MNRSGRHPTAGSPRQESIVDGGADPRQASGAAAEALAADYLQGKGLQILARNVRCRGGEIDLIGRDRAGCIIFVEVRLRRSRHFASAAESITARKQQRIIHAARWWLHGPGRAWAQAPCRFDAVLLDALAADRLHWLQAAFDSGGNG